MLMSGAPMRLIRGSMVVTSAVLPEFEMASTTACLVIMPRSPWLASPGWTTDEGVPVLARVAALLLPPWPDFPIPVTTTRPVHARMMSLALTKLASMRSSRRAMALCSIWMARWADWIRSCGLFMRARIPGWVLTCWAYTGWHLPVWRDTEAQRPGV